MECCFDLIFMVVVSIKFCHKLELIIYRHFGNHILVPLTSGSNSSASEISNKYCAIVIIIYFVCASRRNWLFRQFFTFAIQWMVRNLVASDAIIIFCYYGVRRSTIQKWHGRLYSRSLLMKLTKPRSMCFRSCRCWRDGNQTVFEKN